jgi:hypothetical protein
MQEIYDTFRSADGGFNPSSGYFIRVGEPVAARFINTTTTAFALDAMDLPLKGAFGGPAQARVSLRLESGGEPGAILESFDQLGIALNPATFAAGTYSFVSVSHPLMQPGLAYWVTVENIATDGTRPFWNANLLNVRDPVVEFRISSNTWFHYDPAQAVTPAIRIVATSAPEPAAATALGCASVVYHLGRHRGWRTTKRHSATPGRKMSRERSRVFSCRCFRGTRGEN